jgi:hypothetical protein
MEVSGQLHAPATLPKGERASGTHWIGGWVDPRTGLDDVEISLDPTRTRNSDPSVVNKSKISRKIINMTTILTLSNV